MDQKANRRETKVLKRGTAPANKSGAPMGAERRLEILYRQSQSLANRIRVELEEARRNNGGNNSKD